MCIKGLTLSPILGDGMILQREAINYIYGKDSEASMVTVYFMGSEYSATVDDNDEFKIELPPIEAGGPYELTVKGSREITIRDILFGDIYILSGQSNMELPLRRVLDVSGDEIEHTSEPLIRQYHIPPTFNFKEGEEYMNHNSWKMAMGEDLLDFSAAGYFFAKEIMDSYQIPVGLILTAAGGSCIEAWMNPVTLQHFGDYESMVKEFKSSERFNEFLRIQQEDVNNWVKQLEEDEKKVSQGEDLKSWDSCTIPSLVSDYPCDGFQGVVYLSKEVFLREEPQKGDDYIYMGTIIDSDTLWINDQEVGRTEYRYPPRKYRIKQGILKQGWNRITIRIVINNKNGGTVKGKPYHLHYNDHDINLEGEWYYRIGKKAEIAMPSVTFPPSLPIGLYHTAVVPLSKLAVKGVLWYQGESNTRSPKNYAEKFTAMVSDFRELFGWEVPFIYVQLPNYREPLNNTEDSGWAELRDQQRQCLTIYDVAMITSLDIGEYNDLHPQRKKEIGVRLANAAKSLIYNEEIIYSGPVPKRASVVGETVKIVFKYLEDNDREQSLKNFELAGKDGIFHKAKALRKGKYVYLVNEEINLPKYVRYAWCDNPQDINFFNESGLPAAGFLLEL